MSATFDNIDSPALDDDLSALSWVSGELRRSLDTAHKSLRRYLKEAEANAGSDLAAVDPSVLRTARAQIHAGAGALAMVGQPQAATVLRASEAAVQRMMARPAMVDVAGVTAIEKASFAVLDFIARLLARKDISPVMLFPQYRAVQTLAGAERIHPADLWPFDWQWHELPDDARATPRAANDSTRGLMEAQALTLMRQTRGEAGREALMQMSDLCADLGAGALESSFGGHKVATFWRLAAAVFEAQAQGLLVPDMYSKRLASGMLTQLRQRIRGQGEVSESQARDLLFFCAHAKAPANPEAAQRLAAVRRTWNLDASPTADYETMRLGRHDPAVLALARKRVAIGKDSWSAVAGGELHRIGGLNDQFLLIGESVTKLFPEGEALSRSMHTAITQTVERGAEPPPALAMEMATAMLYVDAALEDGQFDHPELAERVQRLARRIDEVRIGADPQPLDAWMEDLYRRVSDRQTMGSVVQELRASLSEVEKHIDQYFRNPARRDVLVPVPAQLSAMRGVLSVLGMDQASQAALHMRDNVEALAQTEVDPQQAIRAGTFNHLADNLGALSFLIDMLSVQPQLAKSLFRFDVETCNLSTVMGQSERVSAFAAFDDDATVARAPLPSPEGARAPSFSAAQPLAMPVPVLPSFGLPTAALSLGSSPAALSLGSSFTAPSADTGLEDDAEMREIFIDEAREVIAEARAAMQRLADAPDNASELMAIRRAFHTLKGSARMIGLHQFGEAGWACEQLYNDRMASAPRMDSDLRDFTADALHYMGDWAEAISSGQPRGHHAADVARAADSLRLRGERMPVAVPQAGVGAAAAPDTSTASPAGSDTVTVTDTTTVTTTDPTAGSLAFDHGAVDIGQQAVSPPAPEPEPVVPPVPPVPTTTDGLLNLDFDLQGESIDDAADLADLPDLPLLPDLPPLPDLPDRPDLPLSDDDTSQTLQLRVPDLPSSGDLDLGLPAAAAAAPLTALSFDLDLNGLDDAAPSAPPPAAAIPEGDAAELSLDDFGDIFGDKTEPLSAPLTQALAEPLAPQPAVESVESVPHAAADEEDEPFKQIGPLRISIPLFSIYLNEADEVSRRLGTELSEWALEWERHAVPPSSVALAHSLAGSSATVGYADLSSLSRALEHALMRSHAQGKGRPGEAALFNDVGEEIRRLLHQFAAGFLRSVAPELTERLADHERWPVEATATPETFYGIGGHADDDDDLDEAADTGTVDLLLDDAPAPHDLPVAAEPEAAYRLANEMPADVEPPALDEVLSLPLAAVPPDAPAAATAPATTGPDAIDADLFPIFEEEADELLPQLQTRLREWLHKPEDPDASTACMRTLHTLKGGARLAGAMRIGEMAHALETAIEGLGERGHAVPADIEPLLAQADAMSVSFDALRRSLAAGTAVPAPAAAAAAGTSALATATAVAAVSAAAARVAPLPAPVRTQPVVDPSAVDWSRLSDASVEAAAAPDRSGAGAAVVRVRAGLLDRLVNQAGEVSITRARIDADVRQLQSWLGDLTESMERMRRQLRDIELQAETQIATRIEAAKAAAQAFDPLEMDRFTRFQELTRFMAESVNDVATLQRSLQRTLQSTEDELAAQARLTRELQDDLLRTRMIEFDSISERLFRTARQAAAETAKKVKVDVVGGAIEIDRGVLERMAGSFEHLLRNCVAHGIETPEGRAAAGKDATGTITITVAQSGNEVAVEFGDDGAGLNLARIRQRGRERGLLTADANPTDAELTGLIFASGFSTAESVTELAGRGVGLDVVRAEVNAMGGRIETASEPGRGTRFKLLLPLTTAVTQVVMLRAGDVQVAVPSPLIEIISRIDNASVAAAYESGHVEYHGERLPFYWLPALLRAGVRGNISGRTQAVAIVRSASQRVAVHVDEVLGNQEVVVKNVGPQLSRLPGLAGVTLLPSGSVALIYNPVALSALYGNEARERQRSGGGAGLAAVHAETTAEKAPLVMVVDDSLTVRRVTQRLLQREGYRVVLAKDGLDALERLGEERPVVVLSDIEMPRMDGFDLVRNLRADARLASLPVVMITSRIAQKHREYAAELGVQHYLGKPYSEEELLILVARYSRAQAAA